MTSVRPINFVWYTLAGAVTIAACAAVSFLRHDTRPVVEPEPSVPLTVSLDRCESLMEARHLMTTLQLHTRWPPAPTTPVVWRVRVMDILPGPQGGAGVMVLFSCSGDNEKLAAGTFYTTAGELGHQGGQGINRGTVITIRGNLRREPTAWGAMFTELSVIGSNY